MIARADILDVLRTIPDPEMPISIVDLGIIEHIAIETSRDRKGAEVLIDVLPTFVGCPALSMIQDDIERKLGALPDIESVKVNFVFDPPWTVDRITDVGRASLREHGVTVPEQGSTLPRLHHSASATVPLTASAAPICCPFCGSNATRLESAFGPTRCRMIYYCDACRNSFEHMKRL